MNNQAEIKTTLPEGFLLGAASSAHQVEGNNMNSDWWYWEQQGRLPRSGQVADHYNRFDEDLNIAVSLGLNAMRISIEWSRIEPVAGKWDTVAIEHYKKVLRKMKELNLVRMVTLHHFTLPLWLVEKGGFETSDGVQAFARFAWFVAQNLGQEIDLWVTINEPEVYAQMGFNRGTWPPFKKSKLKMVKVFHNLIKAHNAAYRAIKQVVPEGKVGIAKNNVYYEPYQNTWINRMVCSFSNYFGNEYFLNRIKHELDFIGLNYYFYHSLKFSANKGYEVMNSEGLKSDMGWQTFPKGIFYLLKNLKKYKLPVYITENGIANAHDDMRKDYIREHIAWALKAKEEGVDVRGYFYWTLTDTYEWHDGFNPKFGLVEVNFETQERKIRPSAVIIKEIMKPIS
jgi:beta-glucosidase